ncbi:right-handed parallel beta-helix repeat-containing protein [Pedobacter sp. SYSU D00535]|uniref:right-handed parallel beta-helix repeat-containing protein n=1 Tax=Pedobacter sp. SYSU D00535 TaxID=2810308 RepID=UPI001A9764EC|nr:right-handed parallel beta-helix repeat-containing protein [Pedobacter sp. SYSU D00535]
MRKVNRYFLILLGLVVFSCKKDNSEESQNFSVRDIAVSATRLAGVRTDGLSDKKQELQELIDKYARQRRAIRLDKGKYVISGALNIPSNTSLEGTEDGTEIVLQAGSSASQAVLNIAEGSRNITIKNIRINADQAKNSGANLSAVLISEGSSDLYFSNVVFAGGRDRASVQVEGSESSNLRFLNCVFSESGKSAMVLKGANNVIVSESTFEKWGSQDANSPAVLFTGQDNSEVQVVNNTFSNSLGKRFAIESAGAKVTASKISGNKLNDALNLGGNGIYGHFSKTEVSNNVLAGGSGSGSTIELIGTENVVSNNTTASAGTIEEPVATPVTPAPAPAPAPAPVLDPVITPAPSTGSASYPFQNVGDQRNNLQQLINTHASKGTVLRLPAGRYVISNVITLPSNTSIEGVGPGTEIFLTGGSAAGRNVFRINKGTSNIKLRNLKLNANQSQNSGADLVALYVTEGVNGIDCEGVTIAGGRDRGVVQIKGLNHAQTTNVRFVNCVFPESGRTGIELRGTRNVVISKCLFTDWGSQNPHSPAIQLQSQDNVNVQITENTFNNTMGIQFAIECAAAYVVDSKISNNRLNDPKNLGGNGISGYFKNTEVSNNVLTGGNGNQRSGLEIFGVRNNIISNTISAGLIAIAHGLGEDGAYINIKNNTVKSKGQNASGILMGNGRYDLHDITVANNYVDTRAATGNSSGIVVGTYGSRRVVTNVKVENNTIFSNAFCIRMESLPVSRNIYLTSNVCKAGMAWLGVITNTFENVVATGNVKEMANKGIIYSTSMAKISER